MPTNVEQLFDQCKLTVSSYSIDEISGDYLCKCHIIGTPADTYIPNKIIKWQDLQESINLRRLSSIEAHLEGIINTYEGRTVTFSNERLLQAKEDLNRALSNIRKPQIH